MQNVEGIIAEQGNMIKTLSGVRRDLDRGETGFNIENVVTAVSAGKGKNASNGSERVASLTQWLGDIEMNIAKRMREEAGKLVNGDHEVEQKVRDYLASRRD